MAWLFQEMAISQPEEARAYAMKQGSRFSARGRMKIYVQKHPSHCMVQVLDHWFQTLREFLQKVDLLEKTDLSSCLWNDDETGFCTAVASTRVLATRGAKDVHETAGGSGKDYITVLGAGSADGVRLPPYIIYKGVNLYAKWTERGPAGAKYGMSKSRWMEGKSGLGQHSFQQCTVKMWCHPQLRQLIGPSACL